MAELKLLVKRVFDLVVVILAAPLLLPLIGVLYILVRRKLGTPVFFRQMRPGWRGIPFELVKFRTMTDQRDATGTLLPDAQRLTRFGRLLRATSLDELPEFWNVLKGDMSLVGPRPLLMSYLPLYSKEQMRRHDVPPGITGWAQVNGRNTLNWSARFAHDLHYVEHHNLALDVWIMILTVLRVVRRDGIAAEGHATMPVFTGNQEPDKTSL